jgi:quercetin dioxygenase-like cupin family protein
MEYVNNVHDRR